VRQFALRQSLILFMACILKLLDALNAAILSVTETMGSNRKQELWRTYLNLAMLICAGGGLDGIWHIGGLWNPSRGLCVDAAASVPRIVESPA